MKNKNKLLILIAILLTLVGCSSDKEVGEKAVHIERPYAENADLSNQVLNTMNTWYRDYLNYEEFSSKMVQPLSKDKDLALRYLGKAKFDNEDSPVYFELNMDASGKVKTNLPMIRHIYNSELLDDLQYEFEGLVNASIDADELGEYVSIIPMSNQFYFSDYYKSDQKQTLKEFMSFMKKNFNQKMGDDIISDVEYDFLILVSEANYNNTDIADIMYSAEELLEEQGINKASISLMFVDKKVHEALRGDNYDNLRKYVDRQSIEDTLFKNDLHLPAKEEVIEHIMNNKKDE